MNGRKRKVHRNHLTRHLLSILALKSTTRFVRISPSESSTPTKIRPHRDAEYRVREEFARERKEGSCNVTVDSNDIAPINGRNVGKERRETLEEERTAYRGINRIQ